jgi:hypothetical protein
VDGTPMLNSEIKPLGCSPLKRRYFAKVHLRAKNERLSKKGGPREAAFFMYIINFSNVSELALIILSRRRRGILLCGFKIWKSISFLAFS